MVRHLEPEYALHVVERMGFHVRDAGLLASAIARPGASFAGTEVYSEIHEKAAVLLESLARNHPLFDGNKRTAWILTQIFLELNGHDLRADDDDAFDYIIGVATGEIDSDASAAWIRDRLHPLS